jgi:hypothetical protein
MDSEWQFGRPAQAASPSGGMNCRHGSAAFARENISSGFLFALETAQGAKFDAGEWMITKPSVFG